jgi:hypothetical protein
MADEYDGKGVDEGGEGATNAGPREEDVVKNLMQEYNAAYEFDKAAREQYSKDRLYASGLNDTTWASGANLIGTYIDILISFLYARDPDVDVRPAPYAGDIQPPDAEDFAETLQIVISRLWRDGRLKSAARKQLRSALSCGPGWFKALMLAEGGQQNPQVQQAIADVRDNLEKLRGIQTKLTEYKADGVLSEEDYNVLIAAEERQLESLSANLEVVHRYIMAIDFVRAEDMQVSLDVDDITDYRNAGWLANALFIPKDQVCGKFPRITQEDLKHAKCYYRKKQENRDKIGELEERVGRAMDSYMQVATENAEKGALEFVKVVELWDRRDNHIKTFIDGIRKWAIEPFMPTYKTTRFYPYFLNALFLCDGLRHPQSLSFRLMKLQDEYNHARSNMKLVRERSVPGTLFKADQLDADTMKKIEKSVAQEFIGIRGTSSIDDLHKLFAEKPIGRFDPRIYDVEPILRDMERISGVQEALAASVTQNKTATEAEIQHSGFTSRTSADRDTLEDMLTDFAQYTAELAIQALPTAYVQRLAGPGAFWPEELPFEEVVTLVEVDIEAGSSGKPHSAAQREAWAQLLPLIRELQVAIYEAQLSGQLDLARAMTALLRESLKRLDDRVNIDKLIPKPPMLAAVTDAGAAAGLPAGPETAPSAVPPASTQPQA